MQMRNSALSSLFVLRSRKASVKSPQLPRYADTDLVLSSYRYSIKLHIFQITNSLNSTLSSTRLLLSFAHDYPSHSIHLKLRSNYLEPLILRISTIIALPTFLCEYRPL